MLALCEGGPDVVAVVAGGGFVVAAAAVVVPNLNAGAGTVVAAGAVGDAKVKRGRAGDAVGVVSPVVPFWPKANTGLQEGRKEGRKEGRTDT